jgi:hypothetical protein
MRKSRVLLAGVAVAAAAAATSAFTAGNTFGAGVQNKVNGYGEATVTGAVITAIHYNRDITTNVLTDVVWETSSDLSSLNTATGATMRLKGGDGSNPDKTYTCTIGASPYTITCAVGDRDFAQFATAGLAVGAS